MAMTTDNAMGMNRNRAGPLSRTTGKNTMQMASVAMMTGKAICAAPSMMATVSGFPSVRLRWMFSMVMTAVSTSSPMDRDSPPNVMMLNVFPVRLSPMIEHAIARGMETTDTITLRQLPRNTRIMRDTSSADTTASCTTLSIAARTKTDWSKSSFTSSPLGATERMSGSISFVASTTASVDASAFLREWTCTPRARR